MKIATVTDDGSTLSAHFGRAQYYVVFTVEQGVIVGREQVEKAGHHEFAGHGHEHGHDHKHGHDHDHAGRNDPRGRGFGAGAGRRHAAMIAPIKGCDVLLARGMGQGAYAALQAAGIAVVTTDVKGVEEAVAAYLAGELVDRPERRH